MAEARHLLNANLLLTAEDLQSSALAERGRALFDSIYDAHSRRILERFSVRHPLLPHGLITHVYGLTLAQPHLFSVRDIEMLLVSLLLLVDTPQQLHSHVRGASRHGVTLAAMRLLFYDSLKLQDEAARPSGLPPASWLRMERAWNTISAVYERTLVISSGGVHSDAATTSSVEAVKALRLKQSALWRQLYTALTQHRKDQPCAGAHDEDECSFAGAEQELTDPRLPLPSERAAEVHRRRLLQRQQRRIAEVRREQADDSRLALSPHSSAMAGQTSGGRGSNSSAAGAEEEELELDSPQEFARVRRHMSEAELRTVHLPPSAASAVPQHGQIAARL
jgi:hypothetical protein